MAWSLQDPSSFGQFFPDGEYVGWTETLAHYYENKMSDAEKAAMGMQDRILYSEFSAKFTRDRGPLADAECPKEFKTAKNYNFLGALIKLTDRLLAVDVSFKKTVEDLEPGIHQFWPLKISMPGNRTYPEDYYGMRIGQHLNTFDPSKSDPDCYRTNGNGNYFCIAETKKVITGLAVSRAAIGKAHIWRDQKLLRPNIFMSDTLQARVKQRGLRIPKRFGMKEV